MGNTFGKIFRIATYGESHGKAIGVVIDGCPPNLELDLDIIQNELNRRKPGQSKITTQRKESDEFEVISGMFEGKTIGTPLHFMIKNHDAKSKDYSHIKDIIRPSHADYTYQKKYGIRDYRGGGRSSARETAARVIAGAVAKQILRKIDVEITAFVRKVGKIELNSEHRALDFSEIENNIVRCPHLETANRMIEYIDSVRKQGDSIGGVIECVISGLPVGLGEPVFDRFHAEMGKAMLSINAVKGFEIGSGFAGTEMLGSKHNDELYTDKNGNIHTKTNNSGGVLGGITNGEDVYFRVAFKPTATIMKTQKSVDIHGAEVDVKGRGRHDPCVVPRAVPIVEAMAAIVSLDFYLRSKAIRILKR